MKLLQQWCHVVVSTDAVDQSRCRVENGLQSAELTGRKSSQDSVAVVGDKCIMVYSKAFT